MIYDLRKRCACPRCDNSRHKALLGVARSTGTSVQRLFDNFVTHVITERQAEARFELRQKRGNPARGRKLLAEIRQRIASGQRSAATD
jgi:hypothetical protein